MQRKNDLNVGWSTHWENAYELPLDQIPWEVENPPKELVDLLDSGQVTFGKALDVACGSGNYSIFLAQKGFAVTGVDFSKNAVDIAKKKAVGSNVSVDFVCADVRKLVSVLKGQQFDFILDWSLLHHIKPNDFKAYAKQFSQLLKPDGVLLLACFSDQDAPQAGQKSATGKMGNVMIYRTWKEIEAAYRLLKVLDYRECHLGKKGKHPGHCFWLKNER